MVSTPKTPSNSSARRSAADRSARFWSTVSAWSGIGVSSGQVGSRRGERRRSVGGDVREQVHGRARRPSRPPTTCTTTNAGTLLGAMPANVSVSDAADRDRGVGEARRRREPVRGGDVAADRERATDARAPARTTPRITSSRPKVATTSPNQSAARRARVGRERHRGEVEHQVRDHRADARRRRPARPT